MLPAGSRGLSLVPAAARADVARWKHEYGKIFLLPGIEGEVVLFRACTLGESRLLCDDDMRLQGEALKQVILFPKRKTVDEAAAPEGLSLLAAPVDTKAIQIFLDDDTVEEGPGGFAVPDVWLPDTYKGFAILVREVLKCSGFSDPERFKATLNEVRENLRSSAVLPEVVIGVMIARVWPTITPDVLETWSQEKIFSHLARAELAVGATMEQVLNEVLNPPQTATAPTSTAEQQRMLHLQTMAKQAETDPRIARALAHELKMEEVKQARAEQKRERKTRARDAQVRVERVESERSKVLDFKKENQRITGLFGHEPSN